LGLGGKAVACFKIGFSIRFKGCFEREFFVKDSVGGGFEVRFGVKVNFEVFIKVGQC
jgi:hypothetical protein